jgi:hypothetical protein
MEINCLQQGEEKLVEQQTRAKNETTITGSCKTGEKETTGRSN